MKCQHVREEVASSLLSREPLSPTAADHLASCPECGSERDRLAEVIRLLESADLGDIPAREAPDEEAPDEAFVDRLLREASRRRRSRRRVAVAVAAGLLLVAAGIGAAVITRVGDAPAPVAERARAVQGGIAATVTATPAEAGTDVLVAIRGVPPGTDCVLRVRDTAGGEEQAARWQAAYDGTAKIVGTVPTPVDAITAVDVVDTATDQVLLTVPLA